MRYINLHFTYLLKWCTALSSASLCQLGPLTPKVNTFFAPRCASNKKSEMNLSVTTRNIMKTNPKLVLEA